MTDSLFSQLQHAADNAILKQQANGVFPAGHNGPYLDAETPVRNTAHFLYLLAHLYAKTGEVRYKTASASAIQFLQSREARPGHKTFHCRNKQGKDACNGLVGQAWVIEALVKAAEVYQRDDCYQLAEEVYLLHPWTPATALWCRVNPDGQVLTIDRTFNHQLWFAMAAAMLKRTPLAIEHASTFLARIASKVETYPNGVIYHNSQLGRLIDYRHLGLRMLLSQAKSFLHRKANRQRLYSKSVGYHGFNLLALARLKTLLPNAPLWQSKLMQHLMAPCHDAGLLSDMAASEYGYFYNLSGLENAYAIEAFENNVLSAQKWIDLQFEHAGNPVDCTLTRQVADAETARARIYIAALLHHDYQVKIECQNTRS